MFIFEKAETQKGLAHGHSQDLMQEPLARDKGWLLGVFHSPTSSRCGSSSLPWSRGTGLQHALLLGPLCLLLQGKGPINSPLRLDALDADRLCPSAGRHPITPSLPSGSVAVVLEGCTPPRSFPMPFPPALSIILSCPV